MGLIASLRLFLFILDQEHGFYHCHMEQVLCHVVGESEAHYVECSADASNFDQKVGHHVDALAVVAGCVAQDNVNLNRLGPFILKRRGRVVGLLSDCGREETVLFPRRQKFADPGPILLHVDQTMLEVDYRPHHLSLAEGINQGLINQLVEVENLMIFVIFMTICWGEDVDGDRQPERELGEVLVRVRIARKGALAQLKADLETVLLLPVLQLVCAVVRETVEAINPVAYLRFERVGVLSFLAETHGEFL